ncbi:MFS transporter [Kibdelosporangium persicum]|uniref:Multidrug resistance protein n=1 Tax=Kibdelosporangium persicum TaxID=2698649 RepID=A0ABX2FDJ3_9PSEU|nr:MFS transporter [Kibdelosporangium persicum]NRN69441.1 Multidrug resistance protein [Kibdelosporangium persicum]
MPSTAHAETDSSPQSRAPRRVLAILVGSQILSGAGLAAGVTVGALLAQDMLGSTNLAGLPSALFTTGSGIHIGAMYLPSPLTGWLVDRYGRLTLAAASGITLLAAGIIAATAPGDSIALLALALALLGLGWNFGLVSGTAIITDTVPLATRAKTQGLIDVSIAIAEATGGLASGVIVGTVGSPVLALAGGILALSIVPAVIATRSTAARS